MHASEPLPARLIGALFVERGLVSESQIRVALEIQRETGQQLGQVLVERFGVSRKELASVVADQWAKLGGSSGPEDRASWRRLGEIFVERGFVTEDELEQALTRQRQTGERLGEALVAQGVISKFELAGALAEQMATLEDLAEPDEPVEQPEATVHHLPTRTPDLAEIPFGTVVPPDTTDEPELSADDVAEHVADDAGEIAREPEHLAPEVGGVIFRAEDVGEESEAAEVVFDRVDDADAVLEPVETFAIDDVGEVRVESDAAEVAEVVLDRVDDADSALEPVETFAIDDVGEVRVESEAAEVVLDRVDDADATLEPVETFAIDDVGEVRVESEAAEVAEVVLDRVDDAGATLEPVETFAIDDVGHVSLVGATTEPVEPEPPEAAPTALFDDLRDAILADVSSVDEPQVEQLPSVACLAFAPTTDGYRLVTLESLPEPGETIAVPDVGERLVLRVGRSPIPGDRRLCVYVEEPVTPAPVRALAH